MCAYVQVWWQILVFGFVVSLIVAFVIIRILRLPCMMELLVWGILFGILVSLIYSGYKYMPHHRTMT